MKKFIGFFAILMFLGFNSVNAQEDKENKKQSESAHPAKSKKSKSMTRVSKDKMGPNGEAIYEVVQTRYYWVDDKGERHYVEAVDLKPKAKQ
jgi:hypothetical protein